MTDVVDVLRKRVVCSDYRKDKKSCGDQCDCVEIERAAVTIETMRASLRLILETAPFGQPQSIARAALREKE